MTIPTDNPTDNPAENHTGQRSGAGPVEMRIPGTGRPWLLRYLPDNDELHLRDYTGRLLARLCDASPHIDRLAAARTAGSPSLGVHLPATGGLSMGWTLMYFPTAAEFTLHDAFGRSVGGVTGTDADVVIDTLEAAR